MRGPAAPAGEHNPFPHVLPGRQPAAAPSGGADTDELEAAIREDTEGRGIPHDRVRTMRQSWEQRAKAAAQREAVEQFRQDFAPVLEELMELRQLRGQMDPAKIKAGVAESILKGLGVEPEQPKPQFVTREEYESGIKKAREDFNREAQHRADVFRAQQEIEAAKGRHGKWFETFPGLEEIAAAIWGTPHAMRTGVSMGQIADGLVSMLEKGIGAYNEKYVQEKEREAATEQPIKPGAQPALGRKPSKPDHSPEGTAKAAIAFLERAKKQAG